MDSRQTGSREVNYTEGQTHHAPDGRKRHFRKDIDPFLTLNEASKGKDVNPREKEVSKDSFLTRFILTPLIAISFLLSLSWVNFRDRSYRVSEHPPESGLPRWSWAALRGWFDPEPYTTSDEWIRLTESTNESSSKDSHGSEVKIKSHDKEKWYIKKKHRAMTKMELSDAWEIRGIVTIALLVCVVLLCFLIVYSLIRAWSWRKKP